jgi:hypothetical protein
MSGTPTPGPERAYLAMPHPPADDNVLDLLC